MGRLNCSAAVANTPAPQTVEQIEADRPSEFSTALEQAILGRGGKVNGGDGDPDQSTESLISDLTRALAPAPPSSDHDATRADRPGSGACEHSGTDATQSAPSTPLDEPPAIPPRAKRPPAARHRAHVAPIAEGRGGNRRSEPRASGTEEIVTQFAQRDLPPQSEDAERAVLGACLMDRGAFGRVRTILTEGDFYAAPHRAIWRGIERVLHEDQLADVLTVTEALRVAGELEGVGGLVYLQGLAGSTPSAANVAHYAAIVAGLAHQRQMAGDLEAGRLAALAPGADLDEVRAQVEKALSVADSSRAFDPIDLAALAALDPTPPQALMPGLPVGYATLLAGHGGAGKSQIALMLAVCLASGRFFFGLQVERRRVLFLSCEDRADVLHWRLSRICAWVGADLASLAGWLQIVDAVGQDAILWRADPRARFTVTPAYHLVAGLMREKACDVLMVDGITDTFGGNENDKVHVKAYVNSLLALVQEDRGALVLIGHVPKATAGGFSTEGYSGSAGWHNACRARWYLYPESRPGDEGDRAERTGAMLLELQKSNHGTDGTSLRFEWDESAHLFVGQVAGGATPFDRAHQEREESRGILEALQASIAAGVRVPTATTGRRTAFHVLLARPEFPATFKPGNKAQRDRFWRRVEVLRQKGAITEASYQRDNRHKASELVLTSEGVRQCV